MVSQTEYAVLAAKQGKAGPVVECLRSDGSHESLLRELIRCLLGTSRWRLVFKIRNGRPPHDPDELWQKGNERKVAERLRLVLAQPNNAETFIRELANALNANGPTKWQLVFKRHVGQRAPSILRKTIKNAIYHHKIEDKLKTKSGRKRLELARSELERNACPSRKFKAARKLRAKNPPQL